MKQLFALLALMVCIVTARGQWNTTGNAATPSNFLGTTNNIPLRIRTNNVQRMIIDSLGRVGVGIAFPRQLFAVQSSGTVPAASWITSGAPVFAGYGEGAAGNADFNLLMASSTAVNARGVFGMKRSRGTLAAPTVVLNNDQLGSLLVSGYDGTNFQGAAAVDFFADGTPTAGNVPVRISFVTGTNSTTRAERLRIGNTGDIAMNTSQFYLQRSTGNIGIGNILPQAKLDITGNLKLADGTQGAGKVLTSDADGLTSWTDLVIPAPQWTVVANDVFNSNPGNVGIGTTTPAAKLDVAGNVKIADGTQGAGKVLTSDANGLTSWTTLVMPTPQWTVAGNDIFNSNTGNVGIGTNVPVKKLEVSGVGGLKVSSSNNSSSNSTDWIAGNFGNANIGGDRVVMGNLLGYATIGAHNAALSGWSHLILNRDGGNVVIGNMYPSYKLTVNGSTYCVSGAWMGSDVRYKKNIQTIGNALQRVLQLRGVTYDFRTEEFPKLNFDKDKQIGVIAQEVEKVFPELVKTDPEGYKAVAYDKIAPILIEAIKEQQAQIEELKRQVNALLALDNSTTAKPVSSVNQQDVSFEGNSLEQNIPNPPAGNFTRINYNIPNGAARAEMIIADNAGRKIKTISLNTFGKGVLNVDTKGLASGTYSYSMIVDGKVIDTRQMVIVK